MKGSLALEKLVQFILVVIVVALIIVTFVYFSQLKEYFFGLLGKL